MIGDPGPAPAGIRVERVRLGTGLDGLLGLGATLPERSPPIEDLLAPIHRRLSRDQLQRRGPPRAPELPDGLVWVLEDIGSLSPDVNALLERWLRSGRPLPLLLVHGDDDHPLFHLLRDVQGGGAVIQGGSAVASFEAMPEAVIGLALLLDDGPVTLDGLAAALGQTPLAVRAALVKARLLGVEIELGDTLTMSSGLRATLTGDSSGGLGGDDRSRADLAVRLGAWKLALRLYTAISGAELDSAALHWAMGELDAAEALLEQASPSAHRDRVAAALAWDRMAPLSELLPRLERLSEPHRSLAHGAALARSGDVESARELLTQILPGCQGEDRVDALHLLAKLPLLGPMSLVDGRRYAGEASDALEATDEGGRALLIETTARLTLRTRNVREAARLFTQALPLLEAHGHAVPFARAVAGLARSADLVGRADDLLGWLQRAQRANVELPHGLSWCQAALDTLMERIEIDDGNTLTALQRQALELNSLRLPDPLPMEAL